LPGYTLDEVKWTSGNLSHHSTLTNDGVAFRTVLYLCQVKSHRFSYI
jgi:hypothetical protein